MNLELLPNYSVSEINTYIKKNFDSDMFLASVIVCGEISNLSNHYKTGHLYFSLKDENAQIKAVMFAREASRLSFVPENGMKVYAQGRISVFERDGVYQLYVQSLQADGSGALAIAFEALKKKLLSEGLFDNAHKKPLPVFPERIGVITSPTGAAVRDIFSILERRYPLAEIVFESVSVQGAKAAFELTEAVKKFSLHNNVDTIIIGRGGGSIEDLWCFNDELLARAIYACPIPVISAVGHETDFTICDFVADVRAATPSAAAELAVPDLHDLLMTVNSFADRVYSSFNSKILDCKRQLNSVLAARNFTDPGSFFDSEKFRIESVSRSIDACKEKLFTELGGQLAFLTGKLDSLNPLSVLLRGYATVEKDGKIADSVKSFDVGESLKLNMSDGQLECEVIDICRK